MIVSLQLRHKRAIVVGNSTEAALRVRRLKEEGALVTQYCGGGTPVGGRENDVTYSPRHRPGRRALRGAFVVVATDRDKSVNVWLSQKARRFGYLLNTLDEKQTCDFYHVASRKPAPELEIAVSTHGASPSFAAKLAARLAEGVSAEDLYTLEGTAEFRTKLQLEGRSSFDFDWKSLDRELRERHKASPKGADLDHLMPEPRFHTPQSSSS